MVLRLAEGRSTHTDNLPGHGQIVGAARPLSGVIFSQKSTSFPLQNGDEIPDTDQCIILIAFFWRQPTFCALVGQFFDSPLHLRFGP